MKCYNCDNVIEMKKSCPECGVRINPSDYNLKSTSKILNKINTIKDFANFIGLFYVKPLILLVAALAALGLGAYLLITYTNRVAYILLAVVFAICFNYFLEMRKIEAFYQDFTKHKNHYFILFPFKSEYRTIFCDANEQIPTSSIMKKRNHAYDNRKDNKRSLRFNSHKLLHPQKPKMFMTKEKFYKKHFDPSKKHVLKSFDYNDESYVAVEGTVHGFLIMDHGVITIYNTPKITKAYLSGDLLDFENL